jgi:hypothetical protein
MNLANYLRENAPRFSNQEALFDACMSDTGYGLKKIKAAWYDAKRSKLPPVLTRTLPSNPETPKIGISGAELKERYNLKCIIQKAVNSLRRDLFLTEAEFIQFANIRSRGAYKQYLDDKSFAQYKGRVENITYWSHPESIKEKINEGTLREVTWH